MFRTISQTAIVSYVFCYILDHSSFRVYSRPLLIRSFTFSYYDLADFCAFSTALCSGYSFQSILHRPPCVSHVSSLSIHLPHLSCMIPCSYWASTCEAALPSCITLYEISVRQTRVLPVVSLSPHPASFRFHLAMDTLLFGYILPTTGRIRDFNLLGNVRRRAYSHKKDQSALCRLIFLLFLI